MDGFVFDSGQEAQRYRELCILLRAGAIRDLYVHPKYALCAEFTDKAGTKHRRADYEGDFYYFDEGAREWICEDVKGFVTPLSRLKMKLAANNYREIIFRMVKV